MLVSSIFNKRDNTRPTQKKPAHSWPTRKKTWGDIKRKEKRCKRSITGCRSFAPAVARRPPPWAGLIRHARRSLPASGRRAAGTRRRTGAVAGRAGTRIPGGRVHGHRPQRAPVTDGALPASLRRLAEARHPCTWAGSERRRLWRSVRCCCIDTGRARSLSRRTSVFVPPLPAAPRGRPPARMLPTAPLLPRARLPLPQDPELFDIIEREKRRQKTSLVLIPSENFASQSVLDALGSVMQNKYSEGYPYARYYGGNEFIDMAEDMCRTRALEAFKASAGRGGAGGWSWVGRGRILVGAGG